MVTLLLAQALAREPVSFGVGGGLETVINDPFLHRTGLRLDGAVALAPRVELNLALALFPAYGGDDFVSRQWYALVPPEDGEDPDWTDLSRTLLREVSVSPGISKITSRGSLMLTVLPVRAPAGRFTTGVGLSAGWGFVTTRDDLVALQSEGDEYALASEEQVHGGPAAGFFGELRGARGSLRIGMMRVLYIETVYSYTLETKDNELVTVGGLAWF